MSARTDFDDWTDQHSAGLPWDPTLRATYREKKAQVEAVEQRQQQRAIEKGERDHGGMTNVNDPIQQKGFDITQMDGRKLSDGTGAIRAEDDEFLEDGE